MSRKVIIDEFEKEQIKHIWNTDDKEVPDELNDLKTFYKSIFKKNESNYQHKLCFIYHICHQKKNYEKVYMCINLYTYDCINKTKETDNRLFTFERFYRLSVISKQDGMAEVIFEETYKENEYDKAREKLDTLKEIAESILEGNVSELFNKPQ